MSKTDNNYRVKANIGSDTVLNVKLTRDIDFLEILTLKLSQKDLYKLHTSKYGVIVGRVLANDGFGVPNVRLSVFIPISDTDANRSEIETIYPYTSAYSQDSVGRRYNLLPDNKRNDCYRIVGNFPNKRLVLDNDTQIEIFDNYWKYTTVTNEAGDYMIFGIPTGMQTVHADIDLSNIGILSQKPRDFVYNSYNVTSFDNASQFKESTNLDNLVQILGQNQAVNVYPFWGDNNAEGIIGITRVDIKVNYQFETTCIFMGSVITDDQSNSLSHECSAPKKMGYNRLLTTSEGTIEMIRKTLDGLVEEKQIQGNQLIDGDGVWCYQIPMNLDYVVTDEYGDIVPTNNPSKGIPTRTSVRFRVRLSETGSDGVPRHRAEYLIPNNPLPENNEIKDGKTAAETFTKPSPKIEPPKINSSTVNRLERDYEFGSSTPDKCFRDLYWNKVYSVKNYIPRLQANGKTNTDEYLSIRSVNYSESNAPFPFNNVRFKLPFNYVFLCLLMQIFFLIVAMINASLISILRIIVIGIPGFKLFGKIKLYWRPFDFLECIHFEIEDDEAGDGSTILYAPGCWGRPPKGAQIGDMAGYSDRMQRGLAQESEVVNLDFSNDWINGCIYMPLWFWRKTKKKKYFFGWHTKPAVNKFCNASENVKKLKLVQACPTRIIYSDGTAKNVHKKSSLINLKKGVIYEKTNKDDLKIYYYTPIQVLADKSSVKVPFVRLFATDIILLGSFADCDLDSIPQLFDRIPASTANIPSFVSTKILTDDENVSDSTLEETVPISLTGMDWTHKEGKPPKKFARGLLLDLACASVTTVHKSIINTRRLCELGVTFDGTYERVTKIDPNGTIIKREIEPDGMITRIEIEDLDSRAMFATLNGNGLNVETFSPVTKYNTYRLDYLYPVAFDGELQDAAQNYTKGETTDDLNQSYLKFRYGTDGNWRWGYNNTFPMFNNSYYFYFGAKPGKTALEKFYKNFYSKCFSSNKEPFSLNISAVPGAWCDQNAHFDVEIPNIHVPYSFKLIDALGKTFISANELEYTNISFDLWNYISGSTEFTPWYFAKCKGKEDTEENEEYINQQVNGDGFFYIIQDETDEEEGRYNFYSIDLTNGVYTLEISDSYGRTITSEVNLQQSPLGISIVTKNLSDMYAPGTFVNEISSGKIALTSVSIDGDEYRFKEDSLVETKSAGVFVFKVYRVENTETVDANGDPIYRLATVECDEKRCSDDPCELEDCGIKYIKFDIKPSNIEGDANVNSFNDSICNKNGKPEILDYSSYADTSTSLYGESIDNESKCIVFLVRTADDFIVEATQYCCGISEESDNTFSTVLTIANSEGLTLKFTNVDYSLLPKPESTDDLTVRNMWINVNDPSLWNKNFPDYNEDTADLWNEWVSGIGNLSKAVNAVTNSSAGKRVDYNGNPIADDDVETPEMDEETIAMYKTTILKAIAFKLNCILRVSNAVSCDGTPVTLSFNYDGGSDPVMYTAYPDYSELTINNSSNNKLRRYISDNTTTTIQGDNNYPTVINSNYYTDTTLLSKEFTGRWALNSIFNTDKLGHYGGVIDINNQSKTIPVGIKPLNISSINTSMKVIMEDKGDYYNVHTIDRRIDCELHIGKGKKQIVIDGELSSIFGGVALGYVKEAEYSIVEEETPTSETEYVYDSKDYRILKLNPNSNRRYYNIYFYTDVDTSTAYNSHLRTGEEEGEGGGFKWKYMTEESNGFTFPVFRLRDKNDKPYNLSINRVQETKNEDGEVIKKINSTTFGWYLASCSYNTNASVGNEHITVTDVIEKDDGTNSTNAVVSSIEKVLAGTSEGNVVDGTLSIDDPFMDIYDNFYDIVKNNAINVQFKGNSANEIDWLEFKYRVREDPSTDCIVYTNAPIFIKESDIKGDVTNIDDQELVKIIKNGYEQGLLEKTIVEFANGYSETYKELKDTSKKCSYVTTIDGSERLPDDDEIRSVTYYKLKMKDEDVNKKAIMALQREYVDGTFATTHLGRKIYTYETGRVIENITKDIYFKVIRCLGSDYPCAWDSPKFRFGSIIDRVVKCNKPSKKSFSWLRIYLPVCKGGTMGVEPDVVKDSNENYLVGCRINSTEVILENHCLGFVASTGETATIYSIKDGKAVKGSGTMRPDNIKYAYFIIPFYTLALSEDDDEDDDDEDDDIMKVQPVWYKKKVKVDVIFKRKSNNLYYGVHLKRNNLETN